MERPKLPDIEGLDNEATQTLFRFLELLREGAGVTISYELDATDLWVLHGVVCLGADHPGFEDLTDQSKAVIDRFRGFCRRIWMGAGLTAREAEILDKLRVHVNRAE